MKSAVMVIDMQKLVYNREPLPFEAEEVVQRINAITRKAHDHGVPVILTQYEVPGYLEPDSSGWQLVDDLHVDDADLRLRKTGGDAFLQTDLHERLQNLGIRQLVVMGYASEICVDSTVRRAVALGYEVALVADAHTTHDKPHLDAERIRQHHNCTLGLSPRVKTPLAVELSFANAKV